MKNIFGFCCIFALLVQSAVQAAISPSEYDIYVGERATPFIAYAPPQVDANMQTLEPKQINRLDVPRALCGATVLSPDLLMTSVRCSPSIASKAMVYLVPRGSSDDVFLQAQQAKILRGVVSKISLMSEYQSADGQKYSNIALVSLNDQIFT